MQPAELQEAGRSTCARTVLRELPETAGTFAFLWTGGSTRAKIVEVRGTWKGLTSHVVPSNLVNQGSTGARFAPAAMERLLSPPLEYSEHS